MSLVRQSITRGSFALTKQTTCRGLQTSQLAMSPIKVGTEIPFAELCEETPENKVNLRHLGAKKRIILFGVPGAFCPGCSKIHLPGYVNRSDEMRASGINEIVCVSVNDPYVMAAWGERHYTKGKVRMLADPCGRFIRSMGLGTVIPTLGGYRSKRFSMIIRNNFVELLNVERDNTGMTCSLAEELRYKGMNEAL